MNRNRMVALAVALVSVAVAGAVIAVWTGANAPAGPEGNLPAEVPKVRNHVVNVTDSMEVEDRR